jgi:dienelactone hydrolase
MNAQTLQYQADGLSLEGQYFVEPGSKARPGVLVFPEVYGVGPHAIERARRLAGMGYAALVCDVHGEGRLVPDLQDAMALIQPLYDRPERIRARAAAALYALCARPEVNASRIAGIGFCFGGTMALELARSGAPVQATVGFHSGLATKAPATANAIKGRVLVLIGADDPFIQAEERAGFENEMRHAKADWQMHLYGGVVHSFTIEEADKKNMPQLRYDARADAHSWAAMKEFFSQTIG